MEVLTMTPFGRQPVMAGLVKRASDLRAAQSSEPVDKWNVLRDLTTARSEFGLTRSALLVLQALLSFHKSKEIPSGPQVVFPSNRSLGHRAHDMADSTLRRNLGVLVKAGLVLRHDSPNGKRYAMRDGAGEVAQAFGFDLAPLHARAAEIAVTADAVRTQAQELRLMRQKVMLLKRDGWKFATALGEDPAQFQELTQVLETAAKALRRKLSLVQLKEIADQLCIFVENLRNRVIETAPETEEMSGADVQNEQHIQSSNKENFDSEPCTEMRETVDSPQKESVALEVVLTACPDIRPYAPDGIAQGKDLIETAHRLYAMMGITSELWHRALQVMGRESAAITLACMLQRIDKIKNPGGYLRCLVQRAEHGEFTVWPMLRALLPSVHGASA